MSLFDSSKIYTQEASIPVIKCPSYAEVMNKVKNMGNMLPIFQVVQTAKTLINTLFSYKGSYTYSSTSEDNFQLKNTQFLH